MCGIAGILSLDPGSARRDALDRMMVSLQHRGPDDRGRYADPGIALGHLRLSILDPTPAGTQPMVRDGCVLVHNGEVYNYLELAQELRQHGQRFETGTDTEVVLAAYRVWGIDAVARFNGMFAFALWDAERRRLLLARDRVGVKPLYLRRTRDSLAFASEVTALFDGRPIDASDTWVPEPHVGAVRDFLLEGLLDHSRATFIRGIEALPAGHLLVVDDGHERLVRYWGPVELAEDARQTAGPGDRARDRRLVGEFGALFDSSVRLRLRSDVALGTCLSGGIDSSSIVLTVANLVHAAQGDLGAHEQAPRLAFHARFPAQGIDESGFAHLAARQAQMRLVMATPTGSPLLASALPVLRAQGEPYGGASINAQYAVMAAARDEGLKVLLDGQGADELLGGYHQYLGVRTAGLASADPAGALRELRAQVSSGTLSAGAALAWGVREALPASFLGLIRSALGGPMGIRGTDALRLESAMQASEDLPGTYLARRLWRALTSHGLPALLRYEDRNSMAFGIEARVPFLDYRLIELAARLPDRLRVGGGTTKVALREAMRGRVPEAILDRRDKIGFSAPQQAWLTAGREEVAALLHGGQLTERGWIAPSEVERTLDSGFSSERAATRLWRLFIVEAWLRLLWPDMVGQSGRVVWEAALEQAATQQSQARAASPGRATANWR